MKIGILGYGEIGRAISHLYQMHGIIPVIKDLDRDDGLDGVDVLNICIPYSEKEFESAVLDAAKGAKAIIIHSTVPVGTTKRIKGLLGNKVVAHSPVRGVHPNLYDGLLTFEKLVGGETDDAALLSEHLISFGIKTRICDSNTSELAKLLDTTYYGVCIAFHGEAKTMCDEFGADFETAMTFFNSTYNSGYKKLGKPNVVRPVLSPPSGKIGGHCVAQNAELLGKQTKSLAIDLILKYSR